jgi:hypothetical protein
MKTVLIIFSIGLLTLNSCNQKNRQCNSWKFEIMDWSFVSNPEFMTEFMVNMSNPDAMHMMQGNNDDGQYDGW